MTRRIAPLHPIFNPALRKGVSAGAAAPPIADCIPSAFYDPVEPTNDIEPAVLYDGTLVRYTRTSSGHFQLHIFSPLDLVSKQAVLNIPTWTFSSHQKRHMRIYKNQTRAVVTARPGSSDSLAIAVIDISNRTSPTVLSQWTVTGILATSAHVVANRYLYAGTIHGGIYQNDIQVIDLESTATTAVNSLDVGMTPGFTIDLGLGYWIATYNYFADSNFAPSRVVTINTLDPVNPTVGDYEDVYPDTTGHGDPIVAVDSQYIYTVRPFNGQTKVIDISNPNSISLTGSVLSSTTYSLTSSAPWWSPDQPDAIQYSGYSSSPNFRGVAAIDISNRTAPVNGGVINDLTNFETGIFTFNSGWKLQPDGRQPGWLVGRFTNERYYVWIWCPNPTTMYAPGAP